MEHKIEITRFENMILTCKTCNKKIEDTNKSRAIWNNRVLKFSQEHANHKFWDMFDGKTDLSGQPNEH